MLKRKEKRTATIRFFQCGRKFVIDRKERKYTMKRWNSEPVQSSVSTGKRAISIKTKCFTCRLVIWKTKGRKDCKLTWNSLKRCWDNIHRADLQIFSRMFQRHIYVDNIIFSASETPTYIYYDIISNSLALPQSRISGNYAKQTAVIKSKALEQEFQE